MKINQALVAHLKLAWSDVLSVEPEFEGIETNPALNQTLAPHEPVVLITLSVEIGKNSTFLNMCIPYLSVEKILDKLVFSYWYQESDENDKAETQEKIVENLNKVGAVKVNKTAMDEFGMGGTGTTGHTGIQLNPWDTERICAGSSSGSAAAVAAGVYPYALGSDTGDSIRKPAAYCGIVGYKPTYGMISRYGLFPFASSLDHLGVLTRNVKDAAIVVDEMKGIDKNEMTTWDSSNIHLKDSLDKEAHRLFEGFGIKEVIINLYYNE